MNTTELQNRVITSKWTRPSYWTEWSRPSYGTEWTRQSDHDRVTGPSEHSEVDTTEWTRSTGHNRVIIIVELYRGLVIVESYLGIFIVEPLSWNHYRGIVSWNRILIAESIASWKIIPLSWNRYRGLASSGNSSLIYLLIYLSYFNTHIHIRRIILSPAIQIIYDNESNTPWCLY